MEQITDFGKFIGRFHPFVVHLPIGFITLALFLQVLSAFKKFVYVIPVLSLVWLLGFMSAVLAVVLGLLLASKGGYDDDLIYWHKWSGMLLTIFALVQYILIQIKLGYIKFSPLGFLYPVSLTILFGLLLFTGHQGGTLTHGQGYLVEYAPQFIQKMIPMPGNAFEITNIRSVDSADLFYDAIMPILRSKCISCHNKTKTKGQLILTTYEDILKGGKHGSIITPGSSTASELYKRITLPYDHKEFMPSDGKKPLSEDQIAVLEWWIDKQALQKGLIKDLQPDEIMVNILERFFGIQDDQIINTAPPPDYEVINQLVKSGYSIRNLYKGSNLLDVKYTNNSVHSTDLKSLIKLADQVIWLDLNNCKIADRDLELIASLAKLRKLNLSKNDISDLGVKQLLHLSHLEYLNLYDTNVSDSSVIMLAEMPGLKEIYLWQTQVNDSTIEKLKHQNKRIKFIYKAQ